MPDKSVRSVFRQRPEIRSFKEHDAWVLPGCLIGLEIEIEKWPRLPSHTVIGSGFWEIGNDDSLRNNGRELRLRNPLCGKDLHTALIEFYRWIRPFRNKISLPTRTSVHIHLDVRDLLMSELIKTILFYIVFERVLFRYTGPERADHVFCLPLFKADGDMGLLYEMTQFHRRQANVLTDAVRHANKYAALNVRPLGQEDMGSIEFRQFPGCIEVRTIMEWINIVMCLKQAATQIDIRPHQVPKFVSDQGKEQFLEMVFGKYTPLLHYPGCVIDMCKGKRLAHDVLRMYGRPLTPELEKEIRAVKPEERMHPFTRYMNKHNLRQR